MPPLDAPTILAPLWQASWQAGALCVLVLALRWTLRDRIPAAWRTRLWGLVFLRLLLPAVPSSPLSLFNLVPADPLPAVRWPTLTVVVRATTTVPPGAAEPAPPPTPTPSHIPEMVLATWMTGAAALLIATVAGHARFARRVRRSARPAPAAMADLWRERPPLVVTDAVTSPALFGLIRGRLLLPPDLSARLSTEELAMVFRHERAHVRRRDLAVGWLAVLVRCVYWFHPLVWVAVAARQSDAEAACDDAALAGAAADDRRAYGRALLAVAGGRRVPAVGMADGRTDLRRRLARVAVGRRSGWRETAGAAALTAVVGCTTLTGIRPAVAPPAHPPIGPTVTVRCQVISCRPATLIAAGLNIPASTASADHVRLTADQAAVLDRVTRTVPDVAVLAAPELVVAAGGPATAAIELQQDRPGVTRVTASVRTAFADDPRAVAVSVRLTVTRESAAGQRPTSATATEMTRASADLEIGPGESALCLGRTSLSLGEGQPTVEGPDYPVGRSREPRTFVVVTVLRARTDGTGQPVARDARPSDATGPSSSRFTEPPGGPYRVADHPPLVMSSVRNNVVTAGPYRITTGNGVPALPTLAARPPAGTAAPSGPGRTMLIPTTWPAGVTELIPTRWDDTTAVELVGRTAPAAPPAAVAVAAAATTVRLQPFARPSR